MKATRPQRVRDPVHGLIVFASEGPGARRDQTAWALLNTPEFQRLRRIRQLGLSEFVFPGATHSRFAHSMGVFHTARSLVGVLQRLLPDAKFQDDRADMAVLAALLHDLGHGPFSHAFEEVQKGRGSEKHHEAWTAEIILNPHGAIKPILEAHRNGLTRDIAQLLAAEVPKDVYHAVVSSSFDADRLDYLRRDRMMTGTGAGAIDFDWLLDNLRIAEIRGGGDDETESEPVMTFCLDEKALQAAESFLLARYHLFHQVYLHKTTRAMEVMLRALLARVADAVGMKDFRRLGLGEGDPLVRFFGKRGETVENYLALDDFAIWAAVARIAEGKDEAAGTLARRLRERRLYKALDIDSEVPARPGESPDETEKRRQEEILRIEESLADEIGKTVLKDASSISIYGEIRGDPAGTHKMLSIRLHSDSTHEITDLSPMIRTLSKKKTISRFYFPNEAARNRARKGGQHDHA